MVGRDYVLHEWGILGLGADGDPPSVPSELPELSDKCEGQGTARPLEGVPVMTADQCMLYDENGNYVHQDDCECWCHWTEGADS